MKRLSFALIFAIVGALLLSTTANAAGPEKGRAGKFLQRGGQRIRLVAELLDMTPRQLLRELRDTATVAQLAEENGVPLSEIDAALAQPYRDHLAQEVADGVLTQAQADYLTARADERRNDFLTMRPRRAFHQPQLEDLAVVLGMSEDAIVTQVEAGSSPAQIVAASGKPVETVIAEMVALKDADLQERVELDLMTDTQKNRLLRVYERRLTARLAL